VDGPIRSLDIDVGKAEKEERVGEGKARGGGGGARAWGREERRVGLVGGEGEGKRGMDVGPQQLLAFEAGGLGVGMAPRGHLFPPLSLLLLLQTAPAQAVSASPPPARAET
jgi:hypothetical protein